MEITRKARRFQKIAVIKQNVTGKLNAAHSYSIGESFVPVL
jgi:hypothetical protein